MGFCYLTTILKHRQICFRNACIFQQYLLVGMATTSIESSLHMLPLFSPLAVSRKLYAKHSTHI